MILELLVLNGKPIASPLADNAVALVYIPSNKHARTYLLGVDGDYSAAVSLVKTVTIRTAPVTVDGMLAAAGLAIGVTSDKEVLSTAFNYVISRASFQKASVETALASGTIPADKWGIYLFSIDDAGAVTSTPGAANFAAGYDTEASAIAAFPATPSGDASMGRVTVLTASGLVFVGGTDALQGGTGGNPATTTNYVDTTAIVLTTLGAAARWDFSNGPYYRALPAVLPSDLDQAYAIELEASGTGGTTGRVTAWIAAP